MSVDCDCDCGVPVANWPQLNNCRERWNGGRKVRKGEGGGLHDVVHVVVEFAVRVRDLYVRLPDRRPHPIPTVPARLPRRLYRWLAYAQPHLPVLFGARWRRFVADLREQQLIRVVVFSVGPPTTDGYQYYTITRERERGRNGGKRQLIK